MQTIWLLLLFLLVSCAGNNTVKDISGEQGGVVKAREEEKTPDAFRFILGPGDELAVKVWRNDDLARSVQVDPSGNVQMPLVGELQASGLTISQLREGLTLRLSKYIVDPQVDITVSNLKNMKVHVLGEVNSPGTFSWQPNMFPWESIAKAGGFNTDADQENILIVQSENGKVVVKALNIKDMIKGRKMNQIVYLRNGDLVYVLPTLIANLQRFMTRLYSLINPLVNIESGIVLYPQARDVLLGKESSGTTIIPTR